MNAEARTLIVTELRQKREAAVVRVEQLDALIAEFGGGGMAPKITVRKKRTLSPEHIAKMQAARRNKKANGAEPEPEPGTASAKGASLAVAVE